MIDASLLTGTNGGAGVGGAHDAADATYLPSDFPKRLFWETSSRFRESRDRILFARAVRNEEIVVPIPDPLISDEDANFVAYIAPERRTLEAGPRQTLANNPPVYRRPKMGDKDSDDKNVEQITAFAEGLRAALVDSDALVGKAVDDGEWAIVLQYDLDYVMAAPMPSEVISEGEWKKLPESEQDGWHRCEQSGGRVTYRRYHSRWWRDREGRKPTDRYYREVDAETGKRRAFERNDLATRRAWREHAKATAEGQLPIKVRLVPALDCAPILVRGTGPKRWETRGLSIRMRCSQSDLIAQGLRWDGMPGLLVERGFDADESSKLVDIYEAHVYLEAPDAGPDEPLYQPHVVYQIDGAATWREGAGGEEPAAINLWREYGIDFLPVEYFHGPHSEDDDPDQYAQPLIHPVLATILNQEGLRTAYQAHIRKYSFSKLAMTPAKDVPSQTYLNSDGSIKDIDMDADIVLLPGPVGPMVAPPAPQAVKHLGAAYSQTLAVNAPDDRVEGGESGHAMTVALNQYLAGNRHVREGVRKCVEWIGTTALRMLAALEEKHNIRPSVFPAADVPTDTSARSHKATITFDPKWFAGNYRLQAVYPDLGNLAEIQQEADLKERGLSTFRRVMEKKGVTDVFSERVEVMADKFWDSEQGIKLLFLEALKRRGDMERAAILEGQLNNELTPDGLPMAALPPGLAGGMPGPGMGAPGMAPGLDAGGFAPPPGAAPMPGVQLPSIAGSALGGIVGAEIGGATMMRDAMAQSQIPGAA